MQKSIFHISNLKEKKNRKANIFVETLTNIFYRTNSYRHNYLDLIKLTLKISFESFSEVQKSYSKRRAKQ